MALYCDADFAGDRQTSKSTSGRVLALVGPKTFAPIAAASKGQSAVSHSSTESEMISLEEAVRTEGIPALSFWDAILPTFARTAGGRSPSGKALAAKSTSSKVTFGAPTTIKVPR